jgi:hypothetical protein
MSNVNEQTVLKLAEQLREKADAVIVVGYLPGDRFFYAVDGRITIPDLHGVLERNATAVADSVARLRQAKGGR